MRLGDMGEEFADGGEAIGLIAAAFENGGNELEEIADVAEEEVILVAEMVVERGAANPGAIEDVLDGDGVEGLFLHEGDERVAEGIASAADAAIHFLRTACAGRHLMGIKRKGRDRGSWS